MPELATAAANPFSSLIDMNFILINRIVVLAATLLFFAVVLIITRFRRQAVHSGITTPINLALIGFVVMWGEARLQAIPGYQKFLGGLLTTIVLICLAKLILYLVIDIYLRLHLQREVPSFLRDAVRLVVYLGVCIIALRLVLKIDISTIVTTTTVITAAIAFAMQNTLTNAMSGFSIQTDSLLEGQNWIGIKEKNIFGEIVNVGFRYTTLRTVDQNILMVPNSVIMQSVVTYYGNSACQEKPGITIQIGLGYDLPPETARALLGKVLQDEPEVLAVPQPVVNLLALNDSAIAYQLRFWIVDPSRTVEVTDKIYTQAWYAVNRAGHSFPFPHRQIVTSEPRPSFVFCRQQLSRHLHGSELLSMLDEEAIGSLAENSQVRIFGPGEVVVRQGEQGSSLFMVLKGMLSVSVEGNQVGTIGEDSFFGEMSLLTGEPRRATVRAECEVWLAEVTKELMEPLLRATPAVLETLSKILAEREHCTRETSKQLGQGGANSRSEEYLRRLKQFFRL